MAWYHFAYAVLILLMTGAVFGIGRAFLRKIGRNSDSRRIHGWFVLAGVTTGFMIGGLIGVAELNENNRQYFHEFGIGRAMFGLLIGLLAGTVPGAIILDARKSEGDETT